MAARVSGGGAADAAAAFRRYADMMHVPKQMLDDAAKTS